MRIQQARVSGCISSFETSFLTKFGLVNYVSDKKPVIFFGCYPPKRRRRGGVRPDIGLVLHHRSLAVLVWGGSDASSIGAGYYQPVLRAKHVRHVAISKFISDDLIRAKVPHIYLPICPSTAEWFKPVPLGRCIYAYGSHAYPGVYNEDLIQQVMKRVSDVKFVRGYSTPPNNYLRDQMPSVYAKCFMGLRLTKHDGLSNTVVEMGLMGRKCVWNGWLPNALPWKSAGGIARVIREEQKEIGLSELKLEKRARKVKRALQLPENWLTTEFYGWKG